MWREKRWWMGVLGKLRCRRQRKSEWKLSRREKAEEQEEGKGKER
jgi:hypothetical protein